MSTKRKVRVSRPSLVDVTAVNCRECLAFASGVGGDEPLMGDYPAAKEHAKKTGHAVDVTFEYSQTITVEDVQ